LGAQLLLAAIIRSAPVVSKTQAWIMSPWALVPVILSAHTAASANLWRTMIFSIEALHLFVSMAHEGVAL
jgi:hypothetical protein